MRVYPTFFAVCFMVGVYTFSFFYKILRSGYGRGRGAARGGAGGGACDCSKTLPLLPPPLCDNMQQHIKKSQGLYAPIA